MPINKKEAITNLSISTLYPFAGHPFNIFEDQAMDEMVSSIKSYGILTPITVRPRDDGGYEIVSGHRRVRACEIAGIDKVPAVIRNMSRDEAIIMMVDSNLQRENILPSEKAKAYKMKLDAIKRQGNRTDIQHDKNQDYSTSCQVGTKSENSRSDEIVAEGTNDSARTIQRYIRLNELNPQLQKLVDEKRMGITPAVEISYLSPEEQDLLVETIESEDSIPSLSQAQRMRKMSQDGQLNDDSMLSLIQEQKKPDGFNVVIPMDKIGKYFPKNLTPREIGERIVSICDRLYKDRMKQKNKGQSR